MKHTGFAVMLFQATAKLCKEHFGELALSLWFSCASDVVKCPYIGILKTHVC